MEQRIINGLPKLFDFDGRPFPSEVVVCDRCGGSGSHVNPAIDGNGISQEDFDEDPDFEEGYFSGRYDVPCEECRGNKVVAVPMRKGLTPEQEQDLKEHEDYQRELANERRLRAMGIQF